MAVAWCSCDAVSAGIIDTNTTQTTCIFPLWLDVQIHSFYTPWDGVGNSREHVAAPGFTGFGQGGSWALLPQLCPGGMPAGRRAVWVQINPVRTWCVPMDPHHVPLLTGARWLLQGRVLAGLAPSHATSCTCPVSQGEFSTWICFKAQRQHSLFQTCCFQIANCLFVPDNCGYNQQSKLRCRV